MMYGNLLFSKVVEENNPQAFVKYGVKEADFETEAERKIYRFIREYANENGGEAPSYATVTAECPEYFHTPQVTDSFEYLTGEVKKHAAKLQFMDYVNNRLKEKFNSEGKEDIYGFLDGLVGDIANIRHSNAVTADIGRSLGEISRDFMAEYLKRESGTSSKRWDTPFPSLTKEVGGFYSGDVYGIMAESGRGKTYLNIVIIDTLLRQGANVLVKSYEVKEYTWFARLLSVITAVDEMFTDQLGRKLGIPNKKLLSGSLDDVVRDNFIEVLSSIETYYPGKLYFQGKSGKELTRSLDDLERELMTGQVDAVFLDPFYGLSDVYGRNSNNTTGGAAEQAATRFENIIGDNDVIGFYTVQATVEKKMTNEDGQRELSLPSRDQVKTSKRLLDIATNLISFDSLEKEGRAVIGIEKGRNGGEDFVLELIALFGYGVLKEFPPASEIANQFGGEFL